MLFISDDEVQRQRTCETTNRGTRTQQTGSGKNKAGGNISVYLSMSVYFLIMSVYLYIECLFVHEFKFVHLLHIFT